MRYRTVDAIAFGPLRGEELELAPGLNVVVGPNEARKSSWHAAMYAGLCGRRRGRGRASGAEADFERRHRPWEGEAWAVRAEIELDDGRCIELRHDLDGRRSDVVDLEFGRPVDDDIVVDGAPDGSRWLGLDRRTFLATACIRQAEILAVTEEAEGLRTLLQRAASTLGGDTTAAAAIDAVDQFRKEHVGKDLPNAVKPLRRARQALADALERHEAVSAAHDDYQLLVARADRLDAELEIAEHELAAAETAARRAELAAELRELDLVAELVDALEQLPADAPGVAALDELRDALAQWTHTVVPPPIVGPDVDDLRRRLDELPPEPEGDTEIDPAVAAAVDDLGRRRAVLADHGPEPAPVDHGLDELEPAIEVARRATAPVAPVPHAVATEYERLSSLVDAQAAQRTYAGWAVRLAGAGGVIAILAALTGLLPVALVVGGGAALVATASWLLVRSTDDGSRELLADAERRLADHEARVVDERDARDEARRWLVDRGLPVDPAELAAAAAARRAALDQLEGWHRHHCELLEGLTAAEDRLRGLLTEKGVATGGDLAAAVEVYCSQVRARADARAARAAAPVIEERLAARAAADAARREQLERRVVAGARLIQVMARHGHECDDAEQAAEAAEALIGREEARRDDARRAEELRTELRTRLDGRSVGDATARRAAVLAELGAAPVAPVDPAAVDSARARRDTLVVQATEARTQLAGIDDDEVDTAAASAAVEHARREVERVERLGETLDLTAHYLEQAEAEAYRTVAPRIAAELDAHLPSLTQGRYQQAKVDPEQLTVRVRDESGRYRDADQLSHGTAEQIHLLLRVAMARVLTRTGESCPLLIDDATVHADSGRTDAVLDLLLELADERQVVLFSQEDHVREWAASHLTDPRHRVIDLAVA